MVALPVKPIGPPIFNEPGPILISLHLIPVVPKLNVLVTVGKKSPEISIYVELILAISE